MKRTALHALALTAASVSIAGALGFPAVAAAAPAGTAGFSQDWGNPGGPGWNQPGDPRDWQQRGPDARDYRADWHHPEWGPGWNDGYPAPDWYPPAGWTPPGDWYNPAGWAPPRDWVGPCYGPLFDLFHPVRCM